MVESISIDPRSFRLSRPSCARAVVIEPTNIRLESRKVRNLKTLVIGLDGEDDYFWNIGDIGLQLDYHGELETFYATFPSFMCSLTGQRYSPDIQGHFVSHRVFGHKLIWEYLGDMKQTYINIPSTYPAEEVNGSFICGWKASRLDSNSVRPISLLEDLNKIGYYRKSLFENPAVDDKWDEFFDMAMEQIRMRTKSIKYLARKDDPELLFAVYTATDECLHQRIETRLGKNRIRTMNEILSEDLSSLIDEIQPETTIFFSDHSINEMGYHGPDHPETKWGTWGLITDLEHIPPRDKAHILDIFPTILASLDMDIPAVEGSSLIYSESDKKVFTDRLRRLGYIE